MGIRRYIEAATWDRPNLKPSIEAAHPHALPMPFKEFWHESNMFVLLFALGDQNFKKYQQKHIVMWLRLNSYQCLGTVWSDKNSKNNLVFGIVLDQDCSNRVLFVQKKKASACVQNELLGNEFEPVRISFIVIKPFCFLFTFKIYNRFLFPCFDFSLNKHVG